MLEVGEEPDSVTKTGADGGVPAPKEVVRRMPQEVDARGRRWTAGHDATARRGDAAAAGRSGRRRKTSERSQGPRAAVLQPEGAAQRRSAGWCNRMDGLETAAWTACHARYGPTGRRSGGARVDAATGRPRADALGAAGDRGPRHYGPKGRRSIDAGRCSREKNHGAAALRPDGATQRQPVARSVEGRAELGDDLHGCWGT